MVPSILAKGRAPFAGRSCLRRRDKESARSPTKWIAARPAAQLDFFDERNLFELAHPNFPGERACRKLAEYRRKNRDKFTAASASELDEVRGKVAHRRLKSWASLRRIFNKHRVVKRFRLEDRQFDFSISQARPASGKFPIVAARGALLSVVVRREHPLPRPAYGNALSTIAAS